MAATAGVRQAWASSSLQRRAGNISCLPDPPGWASLDILMRSACGLQHDMCESFVLGQKSVARTTLTVSLAFG
eukprot:CAMPEP_0115723754 /NCGR_PEP_ID=MMETSP0272-20121206/80408_1 /TAXON_ID=71861 /ORGANISM="Scrippsiella trochoidea, Strain CCMP3099" /LENGTH=72 /DNA_ID=CAMNT_0003166921 /DNA_START=160 /DNA_END=378 /DNA_ORIENTATION=+